MARVLMLFNRPRAERLAAAEAGACPDELLYGLRTLRRRGFDVITTDEGFGPVFGGRWLKALDNWLSRGGERTGFNLKQAWRLRRLCRRVDLVFATADSSALPVLLLQALGVVRTPVVYASIGLAETFGRPAGLVYGLYRRLLRRAARVLVYALPEATALTRLFALPPGQVRFVPFGVDAEFFDVPTSTMGAPLAFGLDQHRDWPTLFSAAAGLPGSIDVIANPDRLRGLAVPRNVNLVPPASVAEIRERLRAARFVVLPVRENNYSGGTISLLQAMACGKAVIVSQTRAIEAGYGLVDGKNCLLVPPGDVPALAAAMNALHRDFDLVARLGVAAAAHVRAAHPIERLADGIEAAWREACG